VTIIRNQEFDLGRRIEERGVWRNPFGEKGGRFDEEYIKGRLMAHLLRF
jgi:hypothetical protein